jgi:hypothetical protein
VTDSLNLTAKIQESDYVLHLQLKIQSIDASSDVAIIIFFTGRIIPEMMSVQLWGLRSNIEALERDATHGMKREYGESIF